MKTKYIITIVVSCLATILVSCSESWPYSEEAYNDVWIDAYPSYISLNEDELSGEFEVSSSESWYIYDCSSWINISSYYGYGYDNVYFTVDENEGSSTRYGYIRIRTDEGFTKETEVEIAQPPTIKKPFIITSVEVRNIDNNGNVITDFGRNIYSYQTKYLQPRLNIKVYKAGTYTVYTKLFRPNGTMSTGTSSPYGYSYDNTETLYSSTTGWRLSGWGNNTAGNWSAGQYRYEFWYSGEKIGEKSFTIY